MKLAKSVVAAYHNAFNIKFALPSAVCNGAIVLAINWPHGSSEAAYAGLWQAFASFFSTGFTARVVQHFSPIQSPLPAYALGSLIPAALTFGMSFAAHSYNGTNDPVLSSLPATAISLVTSVGTNWLTRRGYLLPGNYPES
ncbi:MAG: hypothetical protein WDN10_04880 [bacterium]